VKKTQPINSTEESEVLYNAPCGLSTAVFYSTGPHTEMILYDNDIEDENADELLHIILGEATLVFTPVKPKSAYKGVFFKLRSGSGGVNIDVEP